MKISFKKEGLNIELPNFAKVAPQLEKSAGIILIGTLILLSLLAFAYFYSKDLILSYNDSRAHMDMARLIIDNLKPGFAQLGGVWLPLPHLLMLPLVWNDWMWQTGLAGSVFSMFFYVVSGIYVSKLLAFVVKDKFSVVICTLLFALNVNLLYMQSTPMTELTLLSFSIAATYYLLRWVQSDKLTDFLLLSLAVLLATLVRYDGWMLFLLTALSIFIIRLRKVLISLKEKPFFVKVRIALTNSSLWGILLMYGLLAGLGIALWVLWNWAIFKDPLFFLTGPYSAKAQQAVISGAGKLFTEGNILLSVSAYWWAMADNVGLFVFLPALIGFLIAIKEDKFNDTFVVLLTLLAPIFFHISSLYGGNSVLVLPELKINVTEGLKGTLFNARYGLMILPAVSVFTAYLIKKGNFIRWLVLVLILFSYLMMAKEAYVIDLIDGQMGSSSLRVGDVSTWLKENAPGKGLILTALSYNNALAFSTGFDLKRFIHEGTGKYWQSALENPQEYSQWIVMANGDVGDPVYNALIKNNHSNFLKYYDLSQKFDFLNVYKRKEVPKNFVYIHDEQFKVDDANLRFIGVNSYDLIYRSTGEIASTLSSAKASGFEVVRLWVFGESDFNVLQPKPGEYNEALLDNLDYILATAGKLNMNVILTLSNYWEAYGGVRQYLKWVDLPNDKPSDLDRFFTDSRVRTIYKNYVNAIVLRKNTLTEINYRDDPTIMTWELMNEPRSSSLSTANVVNDWFSEMTSHIKSLDKYHIVTTGIEGHFDNLSINPYTTGPTINDVSNNVSIDVLSGHLYLDYFDPSVSANNFSIVNLWTAFAKNAGMPFFIEEVGFSKKPDDNGGIDRYTLYENLLESARKNNLQGLILWNWALKTDDSFGISPLDPGDAELIQLFKSYSERLKNDV